MNTTINSNSTSCKVYKKIQQENSAALINKIVLDYSDHGSIGEDWSPNYNNESLLCDIINGCSLYIDFKHGQPTTDQIFDAVYGKGANSKLRVIMYDGEQSKGDTGNPAADEIIVESFVNAMNSYGANLFLAKVGIDPDGSLKCETITVPEDIIEPSEARIPPEEIVRENEFWDLYYWSQQECFFVAHECLSEGLHERWEYGHKSHMDELTWCVKWDETGILYEIENQSDEIDYPRIIWESKKYDLQAMFLDYKVTYHCKAGIPSRIIINIDDRPVTVLSTASSSLKKELAERILRDFAKLDEYMQEALDDFKKLRFEQITEFKWLAEAC